MTREGDAVFMAIDDGMKELPVKLAEAFETGQIYYNLPVPLDRPEDWSTFAVFGVLPPGDDFGVWCGCLEVHYPDHPLIVRLFHLSKKDSTRRVLMVWDQNEQEGGFVVAVDCFETMKAFFRTFNDTKNSISVKKAMN